MENAMALLRPDQLERYRRNIMLDGIGCEGQRKLLDSRVLVVGAGGLGSPVLLYLAAAGVGTIGVADFDRVELSNLQRQIIHTDSSLGESKTESARQTIEAINPDVTVEVYSERLTPENGAALIEGYQFVIEATDNFAAKFLVNDLCAALGVPFSHGGVLAFNGQTMTVLPGKSCCYRCVFPAPPPPDVARACSVAGIFGAVAGVIGSIQATETLKYLTGSGSLLTDRLLTFDALKMSFRTVALHRRADCPVCGTRQ